MDFPARSDQPQFQFFDHTGNRQASLSPWYAEYSSRRVEIAGITVHPDEHSQGQELPRAPAAIFALCDLRHTREASAPTSADKGRCQWLAAPARSVPIAARFGLCEIKADFQLQPGFRTSEVWESSVRRRL